MTRAQAIAFVSLRPPSAATPGLQPRGPAAVEVDVLVGGIGIRICAKADPGTGHLLRDGTMPVFNGA